jgi:hypothetical protein
VRPSAIDLAAAAMATTSIPKPQTSEAPPTTYRAIPIVAGAMGPAGFTLSRTLAAPSMLGWSIIVAVNAIALTRL